MDFLEKPELGITTVEIFLKCVNGYEGTPNNQESISDAAAKRGRLMMFREAVEISAEEYDKRVPKMAFIEPEIPREVSSEECRKELQKLYEEKFSKKPAKSKKDGSDDSPYSYFEKIRRSKVCGCCPICGSRGGNTELDHYLPNSIYPTLCVHPNNLIPICESCNNKKKAKVSTPEEGMYLHLYFDRLPLTEVEDGEPYTEAFLYAELDENFGVNFVVRCPDEWGQSWEPRLKKHMDIFGLSERYSISAYYEYPKLLQNWKKYTPTYLGKEARKKGMTPKQYSAALSVDEHKQLEVEALQRVVESKLITTGGDLNTWESALYRALEGHEVELAVWLRAHEQELLNAAKKYGEEPRAQTEDVGR